MRIGTGAMCAKSGGKSDELWVNTERQKHDKTRTFIVSLLGRKERGGIGALLQDMGRKIVWKDGDLQRLGV